MFLRCPHCGFLVALIAARGGADGNCPQCHGALRAEGTPAPEADVDVEATIAAHLPTGADAGRSAEAEADGGAAPPVADGGSESVPEATPGAVEAMRDPGHADAPAAIVAPPTRRGEARPPRLVTAPRFARRTLSMVETGPRWPGLAIIAVLALLLSLQLLLAQRAHLAEQPRWRPVLEQVCGALGCSLPAWREPDAFAMVARSVRPSPVHPGVLEITATFRNDAPREQAWPVLLLSLSDVHGQTIGARAFQPAEYRDNRTTGDTLAPGQTVTVLLDVVEPAPDTVAFNFDFR